MHLKLKTFHVYNGIACLRLKQSACFKSVFFCLDYILKFLATNDIIIVFKITIYTKGARNLVKFINQQISMLDYLYDQTFTDDYTSPYSYVGNLPVEELFSFYNKLNEDTTHFTCRDDICTPMECVKLMVDYIPTEFWKRKNVKILDPCCGNGNFGAYCAQKTDPNNIYYNDLNPVRLKNCISLLNPAHWRYGDAFTLSKEFDICYDLIIANPPYSGGGNKNQSLSNQFIEFAISRLNPGGYLCFVTPNNWMTYNNNNTTLEALLNKGSFVVIDNDVKRFFANVGSSFTVIVWQKGVFDNTTKVVNNYMIKDIQENIVIPSYLKFIPLYISQEIISITNKLIGNERNRFNYRCDLHNFTKKDHLRDNKSKVFKYKTIHTVKKTRYADIKQDIYDKWIIVVPLSTYFVPFVEHNVNTTQSVGYISFDDKNSAQEYLQIITQRHFKLLIHLTRYGNFNNIMVLKHLRFDEQIDFTPDESQEIEKLSNLIKY